MLPYPPRLDLPWHRRLEARIVLAVSAVVGAIVFAILLTTSRVVSEGSFSRASQDLLAARTAFEHLVDSRANFAARQARLIAELPVFRDALGSPEAANDGPTMTHLAADYCGKLEAALCVITDAHGRWLGDAGALPVARGAGALTQVIATAGSGWSSSDIISFSDSLFLVVSEPALFGREVLGTFTAAYRLDDAVATELSSVTHTDVTFICEEHAICGSSLSTADRQPLAALLSANQEPFGVVNSVPQWQKIGPTPYVSGVYTMRASGADDARLVLMQDWTPTEASLARIHALLLWVASAACVVAIGGSLLFSRRITRALGRLASVAHDVARGQWNLRVPVEGPGEARAMAAAFNHMTSTLSQSHEQVRSQARALRESNERFRAVTNSAPDAIVSISARGEVLFWSQRAQLLFGVAESAMLGRSLRLVIAADDLEAYDEATRSLEAGESPWLDRSVELRGRRADGATVPIEVSLSSWRSGESWCYTGVIRDITDRLQAEQTLRERDEQLRHAQKMEAVGRLAGGVAHDFNNLLTAILGYADLSMDKLPADSPVRADIAEVQKAGRSAASLTRDLLAFSRKQVLQPTVIDLRAIIESAENLIRRLAGSSILVSCELADDVHVRIDRSQFEQVLVNLAVNARDAMPDGGRLRIATDICRLDAPSTADEDARPIASDTGASHGEATHVVLTVTDTGHGMTPEVCARIFEPFFTTKEVGRGTGLGLATVYGIVQQSGGRIWVDSAVGTGSTFSVALPLVAPAAETLTDAGSAAPAVAPGHSEILLLVEDNDAVRSMAAEALTNYGYLVIEARSGDEALRLVAESVGTISAVLTDLVMPGMNGRQLAATLVARQPELKVIFLSGYAPESVVAHGQVPAGAMFIQKPFTPAVLGRAVRDLLDGVQAA